MLTLLKNGEVIRQVRPGSALNITDEKIYLSPAYAGWSHGDYQLVEAPPPEPEPPTPEQIKASLADHAAYCRWQKEVGGTEWNGWPVHTDRESQSKIIAERLAIEAGERNDPDGWKFADGVFRMVSNEDFMALASAVRQHVRDFFALEAAVLAGIEAGTITEYSQIDAAFSADAGTD